MTYNKPRVIQTSKATKKIHGSEAKWSLSLYLDANNIDYDALLPAYEADE